MHSVFIRAAAPHPRRKNEAVRARGAKYRGAGSGRAVHEMSRKSGGALKFTLSQAFKNRPFKISPTRRSQKSAFKIFSPAQILKSAL
jgi:hypothetical protein